MSDFELNGFYNNLIKKESKTLKLEMAKSFKDIADKLNDLTRPVIDHLLLCLLFSDQLPNAIDHWKGEIYSLINTVPKDKSTNKQPSFNKLKKNCIESWSDIIESCIPSYIEHLAHKENLNVPDNYNIYNIAQLLIAYFEWLYQNLSKYPTVSDTDVFKEVDKLIAEYKN